jgi:hypothetical protein
VGEWHEAGKALGSVLRVLGGFRWPFVIGNMLLAAVAGTLAYFVCKNFLEARAQRAAFAGPVESSATPVEPPLPPDDSSSAD